MNATRPADYWTSRNFLEQLGWGLAAGLTAAACGICLRQFEMNEIWRLVISLAPVVPVVLYARAVARWMAILDELQIRMHLEALGFAFPATILAVMCVDLEGRLLPSSSWGWEGLFVVMFAGYLLGYFLAWRRYR